MCQCLEISSSYMVKNVPRFLLHVSDHIAMYVHMFR